jgi:hypothetical protein
MNYNYIGALEPIKVKVVIFHAMADFIFSIEQWNAEGGWKGLIKSGAFNLKDVSKVIDGQMNPIEFENLSEWDG